MLRRRRRRALPQDRRRRRARRGRRRGDRRPPRSERRPPGRTRFPRGRIPEGPADPEIGVSRRLRRPRSPGRLQRRRATRGRAKARSEARDSTGTYDERRARTRQSHRAEQPRCRKNKAAMDNPRPCSCDRVDRRSPGRMRQPSSDSVFPITVYGAVRPPSCNPT